VDALFTSASTGRSLRIGPTTTVVKVPGTATADRFGAVEMRVEGGWAGPPSHVHAVVNHLWYVLTGKLDLLVGGETIRARAGDLAVVPAGVQHTFSTAGCGAATVLELDLGRALDGYFRELEQVLGAGPVDPVAVAQVMRRHDTVPVA
jgi:quercetin dioxygenase-like cupin family protein